MRFHAGQVWSFLSSKRARECESGARRARCYRLHRVLCETSAQGRNRTTDTRIFRPEARVAIAANFVQKVDLWWRDCSAFVKPDAVWFAAVALAHVRADYIEDLIQTRS